MCTLSAQVLKLNHLFYRVSAQLLYLTEIFHRLSAQMRDHFITYQLVKNLFVLGVLKLYSVY